MRYIWKVSRIPSISSMDTIQLSALRVTLGVLLRSSKSSQNVFLS